MEDSILITGATGFIGKHLVKKIPNYNSAVDHNGKNIDLRIRKKVLKIKRADIVIHLAGKIPSEKNYSKNIFFEHNVLGTLNILEYCVKNKVKKIIFVSSYVYGIPKKTPINEKQKVKPHNTYTKSKVLFDRLRPIDIPSNFILIYSLGSKFDNLVDVNKDRHSKIFYSMDEMQKQGYINASSDDLLAINTNNNKIGLLIH